MGGVNELCGGGRDIGSYRNAVKRSADSGSSKRDVKFTAVGTCVKMSINDLLYFKCCVQYLIICSHR